MEVPIPQEIIEEIISYLHNCADTLRICAVVSSSFLTVSRKHLFFSISLDHPLKSRKLHDLLHIQPDIATLTRELFIEDVDSDDWHAKHEYLFYILRAMQHLELLSLGATSKPWTRNYLSTDLQSSLKECLRSPYLSGLRVRGVDLPISIITHFTHLRRLALHSADFYDSLGQPSYLIASTPGQLEALELSRLAEPLPAAMTFLTQQLRHLSINSSDPNTLLAARNVIMSSATSIQSITWQDYAYNSIASTIQLGMIRNLQYLFFTVAMLNGWEKRYFEPDLVSIVKHLEDGAVTTAMKELTISVDPKSYTHFAGIIYPLAVCEEWGALDSVLVDQTPALQKVHILVNVQNIDLSDLNTEFQLRMQMRLPRLAERGVLVAELGSLEDLWTRPWCGRP